MATVAQVIANRLHEAGIRYAFGIPGGEVLSLVDALQEVGIRFVLVKHENCGGFMAEGVHQRTGAPALLVATVGPGLANAVNVVANAQQDRVPLIFLTGCIESSTAQTYTHQWFDQSALLRPITKACFTADADAIDVMIDKAVSIASDDPPGPVHVDIPVEVGVLDVPRESRFVGRDPSVAYHMATHSISHANGLPRRRDRSSLPASKRSITTRPSRCKPSCASSTFR